MIVICLEGCHGCGKSSLCKQMSEAGYSILDEAFLDIESYFSDLITPKWQSGSQAVDTICITLNDYFEDYQFLKKSNFELVINCAQDRVARKYIAAMLQV